MFVNLPPLPTRRRATNLKQRIEVMQICHNYSTHLNATSPSFNLTIFLIIYPGSAWTFGTILAASVRIAARRVKIYPLSGWSLWIEASALCCGGKATLKQTPKCLEEVGL
jgi:hypothetical protein